MCKDGNIFYIKIIIIIIIYIVLNELFRILNESEGDEFQNCKAIALIAPSYNAFSVPHTYNGPQIDALKYRNNWQEICNHDAIRESFGDQYQNDEERHQCKMVKNRPDWVIELENCNQRDTTKEEIIRPTDSSLGYRSEIATWMRTRKNWEITVSNNYVIRQLFGDQYQNDEKRDELENCKQMVPYHPKHNQSEEIKLNFGILTIDWCYLYQNKETNENDF